MDSCDLITGECGPLQGDKMEQIQFQSDTRIKLLYITDPICSACWAMEPGWRKFLYHYGTHVDFRHLYGGLLPGWKGFSDAGAGIGQPADVAPHWAEVAAHSGQPINPDVWFTDPLESSYPPSKAVHTVRIMAPEQEENFLRRIRQAVFLEARNIARTEILAECAADVGLDAVQFTALYNANLGASGFQRDLEETRRLPVRGFPTVILVQPDGSGSVLHGTQSFRSLEHAFLNAASIPKSSLRPTPEEALYHYGTGTSKEFAELLDLSVAATEAALAAAGAVRTELAGSSLWRTAVLIEA